MRLSQRASTCTRVLLSSVLVAAAAGCSNVTSSPSSASAEKIIPYAATVTFPSTTSSYVYDLPRQGGGPVTVYAVPVGDMIQSYANDHIYTAFTGGPTVSIDISVDEFRVRDYRASMGSAFEVKREGRTVFEKRYTASGGRYLQNEDWMGPLEARNDIDRSIDEAMRSIFEQFLSDARAQYESW